MERRLTAPNKSIYTWVWILVPRNTNWNEEKIKRLLSGGFPQNSSRCFLLRYERPYNAVPDAAGKRYARAGKPRRMAFQPVPYRFVDASFPVARTLL